MVPAGRVPHRARRSRETGQIGHMGPVELAAGEDHGVGVDAPRLPSTVTVSRHRRSVLVEARRAARWYPAEMGAEPETLHALLGIGEDLGLLGEASAPVGLRRKGEPVEVGGDVAPAPRVGVVPPGAAHPVGLLEDGEVSYPRSTSWMANASPDRPAPTITTSGVDRPCGGRSGSPVATVCARCPAPCDSPVPEPHPHLHPALRTPASRYPTTVCPAGPGGDRRTQHPLAGWLADPGPQSPDSGGDRRATGIRTGAAGPRGLTPGSGPGPFDPGAAVPVAPRGAAGRSCSPARSGLRERGPGGHHRWAGPAPAGPHPVAGGPSPAARLDVGSGPRASRRPLRPEGEWNCWRRGRGGRSRRPWVPCSWPW